MPNPCSFTALKCDKYSTKGRAGAKLHELVYEARNAGRFAETICLASNSFDSGDSWLAGASHFEASYGWEGLGCHASAVTEIEASLSMRPRDKPGWKETCARCAELSGKCVACTSAKLDRIACPSIDHLTAKLGPNMGAYSPSEGTWGEPKVTMCTPIGLPQAGWYVVGTLHREAPDHYYTFQMAVDAHTEKIIAVSEGEDTKYNYFCELKFIKIEDFPDKASRVHVKEICVDKMGHEDPDTISVAEIVSPNIVFH
jgi:hypothetical protein